MKWEDQKDEENGFYLYYESSEFPANQFKRIGPKVQPYNEIACEKLSYQSKYQNLTVFPMFTMIEIILVIISINNSIIR